MLANRYIRLLLPLLASVAFAQDDKMAAMDAAVKSAQSAGDNAWMLVSSALGADDDRPRPGALLWRSGAPEERARHHDAELHPDGRGDGTLGGCAATAWHSAKATPSSAICGICS